MSIATRIESIEEHIDQAYDELQGLGADLTNVNKNIENISMVLDDIYDSMPQVSGEGTSLTLDDTRVGKIKSTLKGNTSQTTYSGKNLFDKSNYVDNYYISSTGELVAENGDFTSYYIPVSSGNYIISGANAEKIIRCAVYDSNQTFIRRELTTVATSLAITISNDEKYVRVSGYKADLNTFQLELGSSATSYEPYVGGTTSPNPSYPQPVNVVSGDNEINVCGKNLAKSFFQKDYNQYSDILNIVIPDMLKFKGKTITISFDSDKTGRIYENENVFTTSSPKNVVVGRNSYTLTIKNDLSQTIFTFDDRRWRIFKNYVADNSFVFTNVQVEIGTQPTSYEPYQGNTYNIDLPVENLLPDTSTTQTINGVTFTRNDNGTITINGTASYNADYYIYGQSYDTGSYLSFKKGKYSILTSQYKNGVLFIAREKTAGAKVESSTTSQVTTLMNTQDCYFYGLLIRVEQGTSCNNIIIEPQLEKGSKANSYTPFGTTPIELCKIGNYQDKIAKSTGKNLFNEKITPENYFYNASGEKTYDGNNLYINQTIENINYNSITISFFSKIGYASVRVCEYNSSGTFISRTLVDTNNQVVNLNNTTTKIILSVNSNSNSYFTYLMINKGSSATDYEPYGKGEWYLQQSIGEVVFTNATNWYYDTSSTRFSTQVNGSRTEGSRFPIVSNYFSYASSGGGNGVGFNYGGSIWLYNYDCTSVSEFQAWLEEHNTDVYYILATPNYIKITYEPLLEQLEAYYHAKSRATQTNISQVNNDLPFIISASALKEWSE